MFELFLFAYFKSSYFVIDLPECISKTDITLYAYMYHYVRDRDWDGKDAGHINNVVYTDNFKVQMDKFKKLEDDGQISIVLNSEFDFYSDSHCFPNKNIVMLISDDWWDDNYTRLFPIAKEKWVKFNLAIISDFTKEEWKRHYNFMTKEEVKEVSDHEDFEILSHTKTHPDLRYYSEKGQRDQICGSKDDLEELIWKGVTGFVYPAWKYDDISLKLLKECGYDYAYTTQKWTNNMHRLVTYPYELKRIRVGNHTTSDSLIQYFK